MPTFSPTLATALAATTTKVQWSNTIKTQLGLTRRARMFRNGVEFANFATTGELGVVAGNLVGLGVMGASTLNNAADLATGTSVVRIEGNGQFIEYTLGLPGSGAEFILPKSPTGSTGYAFKASSGVKAPILMDSGTGPLAPAVDSTTPHHLNVVNWSSGSAGAITVVPLDVRRPNMVFDDPEMTSEMGDIRIMQPSVAGVFGDFEVGATLFSMNKSGNSDPTKANHQILVAFKPNAANWPGYPRTSGYRRSTRTIAGVVREYALSNTFPPAFKIEVCNAANQVIDTIAMPKDGLPINSPQLSYVATKTKGIRPFFHCAGMIPWQSHRPLASSYKPKFIPPIHSSYLRPSIGKERAAFNAMYPLVYVQQFQNSCGHWFAMGKWAFPADNATLEADAPARANDPYLYVQTGDYNPWGTTSNWMKNTTFTGVTLADESVNTYGMALNQGWGYEPGGYTAHDGNTGPGGMRMDRAVFPNPIIIECTDPNWIHLRDNTGILTMLDNFSFGYFNQPFYHVTDVTTFATVPVDEVLAGAWSHGEAYYGGNLTYTDVEHTIPVLVHGQSFTEQPDQPFGGGFVDANYRMPFNGMGADSLHGYCAPGLMAMAYRSPMHAVAQKMRYLHSIMAALGQGMTAPTGNPQAYFGTRDHTWRLLQQCVTWKTSGDHPLLISRSKMEERIIAELTSVYNNIYLPVYQNNSQTPYAIIMRRFGFAVTFYQYWQCKSFALHFYSAKAMMLMKQTGLFRRMWNHSEVTQKALLCIIKQLDSSSIDYFNQTNGAYSGMNGGIFGGAPSFMSNGDEFNPVVYASWSAWITAHAAELSPTIGVGQADWIHKPDGTLRTPDSSDHLRAEWPSVRKNYFSDIPCPYDVDLAISKVNGYRAIWDAHIATMESNGTAKRSIGVAEWNVGINYGPVLAPTVLGA